MKRKLAKYPYNDYWIYVILHNKQQRYQANLISIDKSHRTTISYARYLISVKLKRKLTEDEEVDHIDNNKLNDSIDNLQILTKLENKRKQEKLHRSKFPNMLIFIVQIVENFLIILEETMTFTHAEVELSLIALGTVFMKI